MPGRVQQVPGGVARNIVAACTHVLKSCEGDTPGLLSLWGLLSFYIVSKRQTPFSCKSASQASHCLYLFHWWGVMAQERCC